MQERLNIEVVGMDFKLRQQVFSIAKNKVVESVERVLRWVSSVISGKYFFKGNRLGFSLPAFGMVEFKKKYGKIFQTFGGRDFTFRGIEGINPQILPGLIAQDDVLIGVEFGKFGIGASQIYNYQTHPFFVKLPQDVIGQKGFTFSGGCKDGKVAGLDALFRFIPNIFKYRNIILAVVKEDAFGVGLVIGAIQHQTQRVLQIGNVQVFI